jgi:hypothetical protein
VLFYGVVSDSTEEALELFTTREEAETIVQAWDRDEPDQAALLSGRGSSPRIIFDVRLGGGTLVDDHESVGSSDDPLEHVGLMTGSDSEAIVLGADLFVLVDRHRDVLLTSAGPVVARAALAEKLEQALVGSERAPLRFLVYLRDPFVDLAEERFIPALPLQAAIHAESSTPPVPTRQVS